LFVALQCIFAQGLKEVPAINSFPAQASGQIDGDKCTHMEQAVKSGLEEGFDESGDDAVERRQARSTSGASAGGSVRSAYRIASTLVDAIASLVVLALYCFVAGVDACPIHHVRPLR
jgi:hypothetical protein